MTLRSAKPITSPTIGPLSPGPCRSVNIRRPPTSSSYGVNPGQWRQARSSDGSPPDP
jgi:hypothetical protein